VSPAFFQCQGAWVLNAIISLPDMKNVPHEIFAVFFVKRFKIEHSKISPLKHIKNAAVAALFW